VFLPSGRREEEEEEEEEQEEEEEEKTISVNTTLPLPPHLP